MNFLRLAGIGAFAAWGAAAVLKAEQPADAAADVQQKINALEKLVLRDIPPPQPASPPPATPGTNAPAATAPSTNAAPAKTREAAAALGETAGPAPRELMWFYALRNNSLRQDYANAIGAAHNLAGADVAADVQAALNAILPELEKLQAARQADIDAKMQAFEDRVAKAIRSATDPKDLDPVIKEVGQAVLDSRTSLNGAERQKVSQRTQAVNRYVKQWQKYLVDRAAGNPAAAAGDLNELAAVSDSFQPFPRSELLNRALGAAPSAVAAPAPSAPVSPSARPNVQPVTLRGFDDLGNVLETLDAMQRGGGFNPQINNLVNSLRQLQSAHNAYAEQNYAGALQSLNMQMFGGGDAGPPAESDKSPLAELRRQTLVLKAQLQMQVTQALLALPDAPAPNPGERPADYLLRLAAVKAKAADWAGLQQVLSVYQQAANPFNTQPWLTEDLAGLHAYLVGDKLEAVGQHLDAIRAYRQSLATLGKFFPADPAAAKLKDLQAKYPDLYQQALQKPIGDPSAAPGMLR